MAITPWRTAEGLMAEFDRLAAQGYDKSEIHSVIGCALRPQHRTGRAALHPPHHRWRLPAAEGTHQPLSRAKFEDGWRVTGMSALPAGERMTCPSP